MNIQIFLNELSEELELENVLELNTNLKELDEWDSMTAMLLIGYVSEKFKVTLNGGDISEIDTVGSLINKIGDDKFEN